MAHDHAESERRRQEDEYRGALAEATLERQVSMVATGALMQIKERNGGIGTTQIVTDALEAIAKLRRRT